jgi:hypothetical protein
LTEGSFDCFADITASPPDVGCLSSPPDAKPTYVNVTMKNLHFHTPSEHSVNGETLAPSCAVLKIQNLH